MLHSLILSFFIGVVPLSLNEAIEKALKNNPEVLAERERLKEQELVVKETRSSFFPTLEFNGNYTYMSYVQKYTTKVPFYDPVTGSFRIEEMTMEFGKHNNYALNLSLNQILFTWGRLLNSYRVSKKNYSIEELKLKMKEEELKERVKEAYYEALYAKNALMIAKDVLKENEEYYNVAREKYRSGLISDLELLKAEVQWRNSIPDTIKASTYYKIAIRNLMNLVGVKEEIIPVDTLVYEPFDESLHNLLEKAKRERLDLKILKMTKENLELVRKIEKANLRPSLFSNFTYTYRRPFGFEDRWDGSWNFTLGFKFPLFDGLKTIYRVKEVEVKMKELDFNYRNLENFALLQVESNYRSLLSKKEELRAAKRSLELAKKAYEMARDQWKEGLISSLEFMDSEIAYKKARFYYLMTLKDYNVEKARLELSLISGGLIVKGEEEGR